MASMTPGPRDRLTSELVAEFLLPLHPRTRENYKGYLAMWDRWCARAGVHVLAAGAFQVEAWIRHQRDYEKIADNTIRSRLSGVSSFYDWAVARGYIVVSPLVSVRRPRAPRAGQGPWLPRADLNALLAEAADADPDTDFLIHLLALNGPRISEVLSADVDDLGWHDGLRTLTMTRAKRGGVAVITLAEATVRALDRVLARRTRGPLLRRGGKRMTNAQANQALRDTLAKAGLDVHLSTRDLRATFITLALEAGLRERDVMASAGHSTTIMTAYYDRLRASVDRNATHGLAAWLDEDNEASPTS